MGSLVCFVPHCSVRSYMELFNSMTVCGSDRVGMKKESEAFHDVDKINF